MEDVQFCHYAMGEGRFRKQFDKDGNLSDTILLVEDDCIGFWNRLQDMAVIDRVIPE